MDGEGRRIQVFVLDPRIFRHVIGVLRSSGISFEVPDSPKALRDIAIVDKEFLRVFGAPSAGDVIVVGDVRDTETLIRRVLGIEKRDALIGVDVGSRIAYAIIQGNVVVRYGKVAEVSEFRRAIEDSLTGMENVVCHGRVGTPASPELRRVAYEVSKILLELGCEVRLAEEFKSSTERPPPLIGADRIRDSDIRAAINLALR